MTDAAATPVVVADAAASAVPDASAVVAAAAAVPSAPAKPDATPAADAKAEISPISLKLPEQALIDAEDLADITKFATEHKMSQAQAEKMLERENATVRQFVEDQQALVSRQSETWRAAATADREFGGARLSESAELGKRFVQKMAGPDATEVATILEKTGLGNHPAIFRFLARAGRTIAEDNPAGGRMAAAGAKSFADSLYG
jgi:hypothetical protein